MWFNTEGRSGQRRMYGLVNLVRHFAARHVEKAAEVAKRNGLMMNVNYNSRLTTIKIPEIKN
jgi:hypothetical protein